MSSKIDYTFKKKAPDEFEIAGRLKAFIIRHPGGGPKEWKVVDTERENKDGSMWQGFFGNRKAILSYLTERLSTELSPEKRAAIATEVKMLLHAHRDCLRNQKVDTTKVSMDCRDGYYGEAFGIMRGLVTLGYGFFGANNTTEYGNMKNWFDRLEHEVLEEEGFGGTNECNHCYEKYGKDSVRRKTQ